MSVLSAKKRIAPRRRVICVLRTVVTVSFGSNKTTCEHSYISIVYSRVYCGSYTTNALYRINLEQPECTITCAFTIHSVDVVKRMAEACSICYEIKHSFF